jgi:hypothetical protein
MIASQNGHSEATMLLIDAGAGIHDQDAVGANAVTVHHIFSTIVAL